MKKVLIVSIISIICLSYAVIAKSQSERTLSERVAQLERVMEEVRDKVALNGVRVMALEDDVRALRNR